MEAPDNFQWPTEKRTTMGRTINYSLSRDTFHWFDWVVYSSFEDGLFCKVCAMFEPFDSADRRGLVNIPFNRYSKLYSAAGKLTAASTASQHKQNALKAVAFLSTAESPQLRVDTNISQNLAKQKEGNRKLLKILLTQVLVCIRYW
jgi:hypothetical protein